jgi:hypothetical protein
MDRTSLLKALGGQRAYCKERSPLYAAILEELEDDAAASAAWPERAQHAWRGREFAVDWEAAHLLLAGMHFWALKGAAPELSAIYPSCGGPGRARAGAARAFLRRAPVQFWELLRSAHVQTNEVDRSVAWLLAAAAGFGSRHLAFHFVELGASAGLNLVGDHLPHRCRFTANDGRRAEPPAGWDRAPHAVLSRTGLDLAPRRLAHADDRLWLKACVWADDLPRLERLEHAAGVFLRLEKLPLGPRLERCAFADAPAWLQANRPARAGEGLLVFNSIATVYLGEGAYRELQHGMAAALAPWGGRAVWVEYERPRDAPGAPLELRIHRAAGGGLRTRVLASGPPRPTAMRFHEETPWQLV